MNGKIYKITNTITNEAYIGKTINSIEGRFQQHKDGTLNEVSKRSLLNKGMAEYGWRNFTIELIEEGIDNDKELRRLETEYMYKFGTLGEYNAIKSIDLDGRMKIWSKNTELIFMIIVNEYKENQNNELVISFLQIEKAIDNKNDTAEAIKTFIKEAGQGIAVNQGDECSYKRLFDRFVLNNDYRTLDVVVSNHFEELME